MGVTPQHMVHVLRGDTHRREVLMTPNVQIDVEHFRTLGVTFLPTFLGGATGVIARYDLPQLIYASHLGLDLIQAEVDSVNEKLSKSFVGCGYYGCQPPTADSSSGFDTFVLFADDEFYISYLRDGHALVR